MELAEANFPLQSLKAQDFVLAKRNLSLFAHQALSLLLLQSVELVDFDLEILQGLVELVSGVFG